MEACSHQSNTHRAAQRSWLSANRIAAAYLYLSCHVSRVQFLAGGSAFAGEFGADEWDFRIRAFCVALSLAVSGCFSAATGEEAVDLLCWLKSESVLLVRPTGLAFSEVRT